MQIKDEEDVGKSDGVLSGRDARSDERSRTVAYDAGELPDDLRIPLHELQADAGYLIGLVANKPAIMRRPVLQSLETKLSQVAEAAYRLNGERADVLNALKSLVEIDDDDVKVTATEVRERLARALNLIAIEKEPCDHPSGDAQNVDAPIAAPTLQPTASSAETVDRARLITAAPDRLAALDEIMGDTAITSSMTIGQQDRFRAAIAKAEGRT